MIKRASEAMSTQVIQIGWEEPISKAFDLMQVNRLRHLPVLDGNSDLIGIISDRDVQRAMKSELRWEEEIQSKVPDFEKVEFDPDAKVRHYMSWPVKSVDRGADLRGVAGMMVKNKVSAILITERDRCVGIVTTEDLLRVLINVLDHTPPAKTLRLEALLGHLPEFNVNTGWVT